MEEEEGVKNSNKKTLLQKYDIPVEHLSFEYVEKCNDVKELEKIVKILRSGEEGHYPQLIASAETRLRKLKPESRVLRVEEPALRKETTSSEQWEAVTSEVEKWSDEMRAKEKELKLAASEPMDVSELPAVRSRTKVSASAKSAGAAAQSKSGKQAATPKRSPVPRDYSAWEKYDADKELTLMEIEEQQQQEERERRRREQQLKAQRLQQEADKAERAAKPAVPANLTPTERELLATREKDKGNDFFKVADYSNAIKHYSASIQILPTAVAYNNRAIAMLKLHRYEAALKDCNEVLKVEPDNVKALMRRGIAHQNRNSYQKAYEDFNRVVALQPENRLAKSLATQMKTKCLAKRKGVRMKIEEEGSPSQISIVSKRRATKVVEEKLENLPSTEKTWEGQQQERWKPPPLPDKVLEAPWGGRMNPPLKEGYNTSWPYAPPVKGPMTDYGLPKNFCNCSGEPPFVRHPPQIICLMCHERKVLGLPPLPGGDCNCPKPPPQKQPVVNGETSDEGTTPAKDESNVDREKRVSEEKAEEPKAAAPDDSGVRLGAAEAAEGAGAPQLASASATQESVRRRQRNVPHQSSGSFVRHIPGLGSPVKMNVASKYICATKREDKSAESSSEESGAIPGRPPRENAPEIGAAVAAAVAGRLSLQPGARITSPYEFTRAWGSSRPDPSLEGYAAVLRAVAVEDLATVVGTKLDGQMLGLMLHTLEKHFLDQPEYLAQVLHHIALLPRFSIAWAFLDSADKAAVEKIVVTLGKSGQKLSPVAEKAFQL